MQHLILMRHAKAAPEADYADDRERPLQPRGVEDARLAGLHIAGLDLGGASLSRLQAMVSTAARARATWQAIAPALPGATPTLHDSLYMAPAETLWAAAQSAAADICLIIAHNPGLHHLVQMLLTQAHDHSAQARALLQNFPTSTFAVFSLSGEVLEAAGPRLLATNIR